MNTQPSPAGQSKSELRPRRWSRLWLVVAALLAILFIGRAILFEIDHQYANMLGVACGVIAFLVGWIALWRSTAIPKALRLFAGVVPIIAILIAPWVVEFEGFTGEVLPKFRLKGPLRSARIVRPQRPDAESVSSVDAKSIPTEIRGYQFTQYLGDKRDGHVLEPRFSMAWDKSLPKEIWRRPIGQGWSGFAVAQGIAVTMEQIEREEAITAIALHSGENLWQIRRQGRHEHPMGGVGPRATPTLVELDGRWVAITVTATGHLLCVELGNGNILWEHQLLTLSGLNQASFEKGVNWGRSGSPLVHKGIVYVPLGGANAIGDSENRERRSGSLLACSLTDGSILWTAGKAEIAYASPALLTLDGEEQLVLVNEGSVTGHALVDGATLWETAWPSKSSGDACASQPVQVDEHRILIGKGYAQGSKLFEVHKLANNEWEAKDVWNNIKVLKTKFTTSVFEDGKLIALSDGVLECVNAKDGSRVWRGKRYGQGQLLLVNDGILVCSEDGRVVSVDKTNGNPIGEQQVLEGITWNTFAVAGPYLLVRNGSEAVCLASDSEDSGSRNFVTE